MIVIVFFSFSVPISAEGNNEDDTLKMIKQQLQQLEEVTNKSVINDYKVLTKKFIENKKVKVKSEVLNFDKGRLLDFKTDDIKAFTVPVSNFDSTYHEISNFTIYFGKNNELIGTTEFLASESDRETFKFEYFVDGKKEMTMVTEDEFFTEEEYQDNLIRPMVDWDGFLKCMGITGALVGPLQAACTGACMIPGVGTAICLTCIGVTIGLPTGSLFGCLTANW